MENGFEIKCDGSMPVVYVGGEKLKLVSLVYKWHTKQTKHLMGVISVLSTVSSRVTQICNGLYLIFPMWRKEKCND